MTEHLRFGVRQDRHTILGRPLTEMFGGGKASLVLEDPAKPLTCGIEIRVQPPGKQVKTITLLSGGEKAFVAIGAVLCHSEGAADAVLSCSTRSTPRWTTGTSSASPAICATLAKKTQFIVITHRRGTMEAADVLYGVTMQEQGVSKLLRLDLNQMEEYLGIVE